MESLNPFRKVGKTLLYLLTGGAVSIYIVKTIIKSRRDARFQPEAMIEQGGSNDNFVADYYANIAKVKPGFPLPQHALKDGSTADKDDENVFHRKSKYEAGGVSAMSRKRGDKLGFLDRRNKDD